ncbi:MAG: tape measure protein [Pseudomonadota bacterium]
MPTQEEKLVVRIEAQTRSLNNAVKRLNKQIAGFEKNTNSRLKKVNRNFSRLGRELTAGIGGPLRAIPGPAGIAAAALAGIGVAAVSAAKQGERLFLVEKRIQAITGSAERAEFSLAAIVQVAQETGTGIDTVAGAFSRYTLAAQEIGATTQDVETLTQTILQLGAVGGGTQQELASGAQQLAQSLAKGVLNGDELRSVMENIPLVAKAIADGLGVGIGQLKDMGAAGELTSKQVFDALLGGADDANRKFETLPPTIQRASVRMANGFNVFLAKINETTGASRILAGVIDGIADKLDRLNLRGTAARIADLQDSVDQDTAQLLGDGPNFRKGERALVEERLEKNRILLESLISKEKERADNQDDYERARDLGSQREKAAVEEIAKLQEIEDKRAFDALGEREKFIKRGQEAFRSGLSQNLSDSQVQKLLKANEQLLGEQFDASKSPKVSGGGTSTSSPSETNDLFAKTDQLIARIGIEGSELRKLQVQQELLNEARRQGLDLNKSYNGSSETLSEEISRQAQAVANLEKQYEQAQKQSEFFNSSFESFQDGLLDAAISGEKLSGVLKDLAIDIAKAALQAALFGSGPLGGGGGVLNSLGGGVSSLFAGFFANGGQIPRGQFGVVGEAGPEIVTGPANVTPIRGNQSGGNVTIDIRTEEGPLFTQRVQAESAGVAAAVVRQNNRNVPASVAEAQRRA